MYMNRFEITLSDPDTEIAAPTAGEAAWETLVIDPLPPAAPIATAPAPITTELITRRYIPGTSIRRLRHHRSAWPRRS